MFFLVNGAVRYSRGKRAVDPSIRSSQIVMTILNIGTKLLKLNGLPWTLLYTLYWSFRYFLKIDSTGLFKLLLKLEEKHDLPGFNTPVTAGALWDLLPWEKEHGEEWTVSAEWKQSLIDEVLRKYIRRGAAVLEIGSGAGRWTAVLQPLAGKLVAIDVSSRAIALCKARFATATNCEFHLAGNIDLGFIPDGSIEAIWSFDVFVHINPEDTDRYIAEFKRVFASGGIAVIHHPKKGGVHGGCRSRMTDRLFNAMLEKHGLTLDAQFDSWGENGRFNLYRHGDCISVFHA
ncbi:MAG: class I SAM-dependent methyltransferase [Chitinispirillaceae bacterium]|nr:class I SAM-dependent methyltransferase [Chitinispirillaceae bacterium]